MSSETLLDAVTVDGARISTIIEPETATEAVEALQRANEDGQHLLLCGGGTRLSFGNLGGPFDVALSTRKLNHVIHYEPDDMTLAVEPGCTIRQIKSLLAEHNQTLGIDSALEDTATIGASVATGLSGPRRLGSGSLKDWLIGIEVAGPDGSVSKAGGMVVKNVTGFDMMHVHYGALGAFGLITRLNLKVFPRPASSRCVSLRFEDAGSAHSAGISLLTSQLQPASIIVSNDEGWTLEVRCDAPSSAIERLTERLVQAASEALAPASIEICDNGDRAVDSFRSVVNLVDNPAVARLPIPASHQHSALASIGEWDGQRVCADVGSGLIYVAGSPSSNWVKDIRSLCPDATFLALPAESKRRVDVFGPVADPATDVVRRLKQSFDPSGTVNRGRFVLRL